MVLLKEQDYDVQAMTMKLGIGYERILSNKLSPGISYMHRSWRQKIEDYDPDGDGESAWGDQPYQEVNALGYLGNDVRHQLRFYGSFTLPFDINFGVNFYWFSGQPYTEYVSMLYDDGGATQHGGRYFNYNADKRGESGRYPANWRLDFRVEKKFRIKKLLSFSVYADIFNVLNHQNEIARDNYLGEAELIGAVGPSDNVITWNNPRYGQFYQWNAPMSIFLGAKVEW